MTAAPQRPLVALPAQPPGLAWPTEQWPTGPVPGGVELDPLLDRVFDQAGPCRHTQAVLVVHRGRLVAERYAGELTSFDRPPVPVGADTPLLSWSMAKSMLHAAVGIAAADGLVDLAAPASVPQWPPGDPRAAITVQTLLEMRDGLDFVEDYVDDRVSDTIEMLFGSGAADVAAYAASRPLAHPPGERYSYSSGTTNILSAVLGRALGGEPAYRRFLRERLFDPIGMRTAEPGFDAAGTWVASSYLHAPAREFARFGYLYLRDGQWDGRAVLPAGWVDHARLARSYDEQDDVGYGAHWWVHDDEHGTFSARGYEGQLVLVCPGLDLVLVRLGKTPADRGPALREWRDAVLAAFAAAC